MTIATEGDEVEVSRLLIMSEIRRHSYPRCVPFPPFAPKDREGWGTRTSRAVGESKGGPPCRITVFRAAQVSSGTVARN